MTNFGDIRACVFDAYGTLFDVEAAARRRADVLGDSWGALARLWRDKQLQYTWLRSLMGEYVDFWQITGDALDYALDALHLDGRGGLRDALLKLYFELDAYPETARCLDVLQNANFRLGVLSNGSPEMLDAAVRAAGLQNRFEKVLSVDSLRVYKPDGRVYQTAVDEFGLQKEQICFMSANAWDAWAARAFGFRVCWINRAGATAEKMPWTPDATLSNLSELPAVLGVADK